MNRGRPALGVGVGAWSGSSSGSSAIAICGYGRAATSEWTSVLPTVGVEHGDDLHVVRRRNSAGLHPLAQRAVDEALPRLGARPEVHDCDLAAYLMGRVKESIPAGIASLGSI